ncbi:hypothetical protein B0T25DRAFT_511143, partial [Lasiosphaeria hispida]
MDALFDTLTGDFTWSLTVCGEPVRFRLSREQGGLWKTYADELESALSLWLYFVHNKERRSGEKEGKVPHKANDTWLRAKGTLEKPCLRLLGSHTAALYRDLQWWMPDGAVRVIEVNDLDSTNKSSTVEVEAHRVVGFAFNAISPPPPSSDLDICQYRRKSLEPSCKDVEPSESPCKDAPLAVESYSPLKTLYAQYMFSAFMWTAAKTMEEPIKDRADVRLTQKDGMSGDSTWQSIALYSTRLSKMAQDIQTTGLGTLEEIYQGIIPPLSVSNKLPSVDAIIEWTREHARPYERLGHWKEAADAYLWLFQMAGTFPGQVNITTKATALLMEYLKALTDVIKIRKAQLFEKKDIQELEELKSKLDAKLQIGCDGNILAGLMGLYETQGRPWQCSFVQESRLIKDEDATLKFTDLHKMAHDKYCDIKRRLEASKVGIDEKDILDWTPLHYLLEYRANVNTQDIRGRTPLHYACWHNNALIAQSLLQEGAEINIQDIDGMAPIHYAAMYGCDLMIQSLIEAGADIDVVDGSGCTPFLWAAFRGHTT